MFTAIVALALTAPAEPPKEKELPETALKELKKFEGKWRMAKEIEADRETEHGADTGLVLEFKGRRILLAANGNAEFEITTVDVTTDPKIIDFKSLVDRGPLTKGTVIEAVYKLDGDTLTMAGYVGEGKKRPANFDTPKETGGAVWILKRVKD